MALQATQIPCIQSCMYVSCCTLHIVVISLEAAAALQLVSNLLVPTLHFMQLVIDLQLRQLC